MSRVIGVPKEIEDQKSRVSLQPDGVPEFVHHGHEAIVQTEASKGAGFPDEGYEQAGTRILDSVDEVFDEADLIVKVKKPVPEEYDLFKEGQELFTHLHLAVNKELTEFLMERKTNSISKHFISIEAEEKGSGAKEPSETFSPDIDALKREMVRKVAENAGVPVSLIQKEHKLQITKASDEAGLFLMREDAEYIAQALSVARYTIYNYRDSVRVGDELAEQTAPSLLQYMKLIGAMT